MMNLGKRVYSSRERKRDRNAAIEEFIYSFYFGEFFVSSLLLLYTIADEIVSHEAKSHDKAIKNSMVVTKLLWICFV